MKKKPSRHTHHDFYLYNEKIEVVTSFKYLGVYFFKNGNWFRTQKCIAEHASRAMHRLFSVFNQYEFKTSEKCKLFDVLVSPVLNYSSEIWGIHEAKNIEQIHTKVLRKILCVKKSTNLSGLYGELGRVPLLVIQKIHMFRYWIKLLKADDNSVTKRIYNMLRDDANNNNSYNNLNWAYQIKKMLQNLGLGDLWLNQQHCDIFLPEIKQKILDQYHQSWYSEINNSQRLASYNRVKHSFEQEIYIDILTEKKYKVALTKFRLSSHTFEIETGRYHNIPRSERKCKFCPMNVIENEFHFLLACPLYNDLRRKYFKPYFCRWPTLHKFERLMTSTKKTEILNISKYIFFAFKLRNELYS